MSKDTTYRIVLDNGGGIVLQLGAEYAHYYQDAKQAADDLRTYLADLDPESSWRNEVELAHELVHGTPAPWRQVQTAVIKAEGRA